MPSSFIAPRLSGLSEHISFHVRKKIFDSFVLRFKPSKTDKIIDLGVTCDESLDSNFFEKLYPFKHNIVATGLEDASFLESEYPGLKYVNCNCLNLPFSDKTFDYAVCSAVIEHVGNRENQLKLLREGTRVADVLLVTTPNRFFPLEFHTLTPFLHWFPPSLFRLFLRSTGRHFFSQECNLNLLSKSDIANMCLDLGLFYSFLDFFHFFFYLSVREIFI